MKYETIDADQIDDLMARRPVRAPADWVEESDDKPQGPTATDNTDDKESVTVAEPKAGAPDLNKPSDITS